MASASGSSVSRSFFSVCGDQETRMLESSAETYCVLRKSCRISLMRGRNSRGSFL